MHSCDAGDVFGDLPVVVPTAQADTAGLRARFHRLVDEHRTASVQRWCNWVDSVLSAPALTEVVVHGDLHRYNQVWDYASVRLRAVVDFEESGTRDPHFDLRYLPGIAATPDLVLAVMRAYALLSGQSLDLERVMAWNVLTVLGDAMWRTEAGVPLPGGGTATTWADDLALRLEALELA